MATEDWVVKSGFEKVVESFRKNLDSGVEMGGSFAAYYRGELVVHVWGGQTDPEKNLPWRKDTVSSIFSSTKALSAMVIAHMVERGLLSYTDKISKYWPEYAQNGKGETTLEQHMTHRAGTPNLDSEWKALDMVTDWEAFEKKLAAQEPYWTPGTEAGYHAMTFATYIDAIVRRVDPKKRTLAQYFDEEFAKPFNIDISFGLPTSWFDRATELVPLVDGEIDMVKILADIMKNANQDYFKRSIAYGSPMDIQDPRGMTLEVRTIPDGSGFGQGTTDSLAKVYGILSNGGKVDGKTMLSENMIQRLETPLYSDKDQLIGIKIKRGMGTWILTAVEGDDVNNPIHMFGHPGAGGQYGFGDTRHHLGWAYSTNYINMKPDSVSRIDSRLEDPLESLYQCIQVIEKGPNPRPITIYGNQDQYEEAVEKANKK